MLHTAFALTSLVVRPRRLIGFVGDVGDSLLVPDSVVTDGLVVRYRHPLAEMAALAPAGLAAMSWALRERGSGTRQGSEGALVAAGIDPAVLDVRMELPSNEAVRAAVEAGAGASVISALVAHAGLESGSLVQLSFTSPQRHFTASLARRGHLPNLVCQPPG